MKTKLIAMLLLIAMLVTLTACAGDEKPSDTTTQQKADTTKPSAGTTAGSELPPDTTASKGTDTAAPDVTTEAVTTLPPPAVTGDKIDYKGADFTVLNLAMTSTNFPYMEVSCGEPSGEVINDAVWERNVVLNQKYNFNIVSNMAGDKGKVTKAVEVDASSGEANYHLIMQTLSQSAALAINGYLCEFSELPGVNLEAEYWLTDAIEQLSICKKNYYAPCYANICFLSATFLTYLNKDMVTQYSLDNPYEAVKKGDWTYELYNKLCAAVTADTNGNGLDADDIVGLRFQPAAWGAFFTGFGGMLIKKDADDVPVFTADEANQERLLKVLEIPLDNSAAMYTEYKNCKIAFEGGKSLFLIQPAYDLEYYRQLKDFGILPMPKYDSAQENYISTMHQDWGSVMSVEKTHGEDALEAISVVLEDMAKESYSIVKPAYYDRMLQGRYAKDADSAEMLDIIYSHITVDLTLVLKAYNITVDASMRSAVQNSNIMVASTIKSQESVIKAILDSIVEKYQGLK